MLYRNGFKGLLYATRATCDLGNIMLRDTVDGEFTTVEDVANALYYVSQDKGALTGQSLRLTHGWAMM